MIKLIEQIKEWLQQSKKPEGADFLDFADNKR